jgi:hypothetical protein
MPVTKLDFDVTHIAEDDPAFFQWLSDHPKGYVLNTDPEPTGSYMVLHTSQCPGWYSNRADQHSFTTIYSKVVANNLLNLRAWARHENHTDGSFGQEACNCLKRSHAVIKPLILEDETAWEAESSDDETFAGEETDTRETAINAIRLRRGQEQFRNALIKAYGPACMITGCKVLTVIEAAHIKPYRGAADHHVKNGLLLRADIHTLYDLNLIAINPDTLKVALHVRLAESEYEQLTGQTLKLRDGIKPDPGVLKERWKEFEAT